MKQRKGPGQGQECFTLLELLVVIGIIAVLLVAIVPAVNSLSKSSGRKGSMSLLLGVIEQARTLAIKDGRATYVAFAAQPTDNATTISDQKIIDRYFYHSAAIFEDDATDPTNPKVQVTEWKVLPTGISLRTEISFSISPDGWTSNSFAFTPAGSGSNQIFPFLKFNSSGGVESPAPTDRQIRLRFFEGLVTGTTEKPTSAINFDEVITISTLSGRAANTSAN
jgi:Tfp pilus assembly protein FimT